MMTSAKPPHAQPTVLHVLSEPHLGLAARQLALLASLPEPALRHKVALLHHSPELLQALRDRGFAVFPCLRGVDVLRATLPLDWLAAGWLHELAGHTHAELIHVHDARAVATATAVAKRLRLPLLRTETSAKPKPLGALALRAQLRSTHAWLLHSEWVQRQLLRAAPLLAPKLTLVPSAIELPSSTPLPPLHRPGERLRVHVLGVPSRLGPGYLEALSQVCELIPPRASLRDAVSEADLVLAAGPVPLGADPHEPVELLLLQAMALGRGALVVQRGPYRELLPRTGAPAGAVCASARVEAIAATLQQLQHADTAALGRRACLWVHRERAAQAAALAVQRVHLRALRERNTEKYIDSQEPWP